jgi:hypothetical protein
LARSGIFPSVTEARVPDSGVLSNVPAPLSLPGLRAAPALDDRDGGVIVADAVEPPGIGRMVEVYRYERGSHVSESLV